MFCIVDDPKGEAFWQWAQRRNPNVPLTTVTSTKLSEALQAILGKPFTAHSIKRGAMTLLARFCSQGQIDPHLVAVMGKHKRTAPILEPTTIRYINNPVTVARVIGTSRATKLL